MLGKRELSLSVFLFVKYKKICTLTNEKGNKAKE